MSLATPVVDSWDGANRRIYLKQGVTEFHWIDDIYIEYRNERRLVESFRKWNPFMEASGNVPKGLGKATPRLLTLLENVKVIPYDEAGEIQVSGEAITDNADVDATLFDISTLTNPVVIQYQPPSAEVIVVDAIAERLDYNGKVYFDPTSSYSGQTYPLGTIAEPLNNEADVIAVSNTYNLQTIVVKNGTFTLPQNFLSHNFIGVGGEASLDVNDFDIGGSILDSINLIGDLINTSSIIRVIHAKLSNVSNFIGIAENCGLDGTITLKGEMADFVNCYSMVAGQSTPIIDLQGNIVQGSFRNYSGGALFKNMTNALNNFSIDCDPATITIDSTNTNGLYLVRGDGTLTDNSILSCIVDTDSLNDPQQIKNLEDKVDTIIQELTGDSGDSGGGIPATDPENQNLATIEAYIKTLYINQDNTNKIRLNQDFADALKIELNMDASTTLTYVPTTKGLFQVEIDNGYVADQFDVFAQV